MLDRAVWFGYLGLLTVGLIGASSLQAQVIDTYTITGITSTSNPTVSPTSPDPNITASSLSTVGVVTGATGGGSTYFWRLWGAGGSADTTKRMEWSITPNAGFQIDFSGQVATFSLLFDVGVTSGHGADSWSLHASTDNFGISDLNLSGTMLLTTAVSQTPESVSLTPLGTVGPGTTVSFRLYGFNDTAVGGGGSSGLSNNGLPGTGGNLIINGSVSAVPEPSSYAAVFGALAFGFVFLTRRLRKA
jgi:hypothetical protein